MNETFWGSDRTGGVFPFHQGGEKVGGVTRRVPFPSPSRAVPSSALSLSAGAAVPLPGFFGRILCRLGSASPTCGISERAFPARCHGEGSVFPTGEEHLNVHREAPPPPYIPPPFPLSAPRAAQAPLRGGGAGPALTSSA